MSDSPRTGSGARIELARQAVREFLARHVDSLNYSPNDPSLQTFKRGIPESLTDDEIEACKMDHVEKILRGGDSRILLTSYITYGGQTIEERAEQLVKDAATDELAWGACAILVRELGDLGQPLPRSLADFAADAITGHATCPSRRGRKRSAGRDQSIIVAVLLARRRGGLPYYASGNATGYTACELVSGLLAEHGVRLSPCQVKSIWQNRRVIDPFWGEKWP